MANGQPVFPSGLQLTLGDVSLIYSNFVVERLRVGMPRIEADEVDIMSSALRKAILHYRNEIKLTFLRITLLMVKNGIF